jgi:hypothetical protein
LSKPAQGDRDLVPLGLPAQPTQTGAATIVAVHRVFYAPGLNHNHSRASVTVGCERSALSPDDAPKDIRANTDSCC